MDLMNSRCYRYLKFIVGAGLVPNFEWNETAVSCCDKVAMVNTCRVPGCKNHFSKGSEIHFVKRKWISVLKRSDV